MKEKKLSQIKMGAVFSYFAMAVNIIVGLVYTPWMVDVIGQSNYGLYTLSLSLISIFMLDFGLGSAVSRFVSKYRAENDQASINTILGVVFKLYFIIDALIIAVLIGLFFFLDKIYVKLTPAELETFRILYVMVAGFNILSFPMTPLNGILNAYEKFAQLKLCDVFHKLLTVVLVVIALSFRGNVLVVVGANIISGLATWIAKLIIVCTKVPLKLDFRSGTRDTYKTLFGFTLWTTVISVMQRFTHSFAPSVLGITTSAKEIALYSPAVVLEGYFYTLATAVNGLFLPRISRFIAEKQEGKILDLMIKVGRYQITVLGLVFVGFVCVGREFMTLWMGPDYVKSYFCAMIIILPSLIGCSQQIARTTVIAKNLIKHQAKFNIISGVAGLAISYVLALKIGALGVCVGTAVASLANTAYMSGVYRKKAGIEMPEFYKKCWLKAIPCYLLAAAIGFPAARFLPINGWLGLLVKAAVVAVIYLSVMLFLYLSRADRKGLLKQLKP